jgi:hypothetical protein
MAVDTPEDAEPSDARPFRIFRGATAPPMQLDELTGLTEVSSQGLARLQDAGGWGAGADVRVLLDIPGFSLTYAWFKSGYPLARHSHKADCAYYIVGGSLKLGSEVLGKGDGFFVPGGAPYTYTVGPDGVEVLEFRHHGCHDMKIMANNAAFWAKAVEATPSNLLRWDREPRPSPSLQEASD